MLLPSSLLRAASGDVMDLQLQTPPLPTLATLSPGAAASGQPAGGPGPTAAGRSPVPLLYDLLHVAEHTRLLGAGAAALIQPLRALAPNLPELAASISGEAPLPPAPSPETIGSEGLDPGPGPDLGTGPAQGPDHGPEPEAPPSPRQSGDIR